MNAKATELDTGILGAMARGFMRPAIRRACDSLTGLDTLGACVIALALVEEIGVTRLNTIFRQIRETKKTKT